MIEYIINEDYAGVRIDRYLRKILTNIYLSEIYKLIRKGKITVNKKKIKQDTRLALGDVVQIYLKQNLTEIVKEENFINISEVRKNILSNMIIYENQDLFIINKNSGDIVHKGSGHNISLLEEYRAFYQSNSINFVNRIDKETFGLVIGAKNIKTARKFAKYIREKKIEKKYYILVNGIIEKDEFIIENYLKKIDEEVIASDIEKEGFKKSITFFKKISSSKNYTLLEAELKTGRTHQLRVQLSNINHSIVGDLKYGKIEKNNENIMYLFSYYLKILEENLEIKLELPKFFINKLNY